MRQLNNIYPRLLLCILSFIAATVAMGQGLNEAIIPIQNITAWEQHPVDGHPLSNLKDGKEETTWSCGRDGFTIYEYMHVKDPDATGNGRRHWVEIPYIPNQNTEIEITFKAKTTSGGLKQNIFGFGYPPYGNGMSLNIGGDGKIVYGTSNHIHTLNAQADNNKHTIICSATSVTIDGGENLMPGTLASDDANPSTDDIIQDEYTSQHNLCLFSNPAEDQQWARCFDGDIYSVKIRENGKLLYDLIPGSGWWGRPGFYDRISTNIYTFFDMVDYVSNTDITDGDPLHIHYKIPYKMGTGTTARTQWTDNLVTNGNFASDDTTSYTFVKDVFVPRISSDTNGKYIQVYNNGTHATGNVWDCHLRVDLMEELAAGQKYDLSFYTKASKDAVVTFDFSNAAGEWHSGDGQITSDVKNVPFTTDWIKHTYTIEGRNDDSKGLIKGIGLNFNNEKSAILYNVRDFVLTKQGETTNLVAEHNNYTDLTNYPINDAIDVSWMSRVTTNAEKKCVQVVNNGSGTNSWDCQFRMNLSETLKEGDQYSISFNIKSKNAANIGAQLQQAGGGYYGNLPAESVGTTWKRIEWTGTVGANGSNEVGAIGLLLNESKEANTYYITDIVIKKGTPSTEMVPNTEIEITYKNTRTDQDYSSTRYLFSYGTKEDNVLALGVTMNSYRYTTGGITTDFGTVPNVKNEKITTVFRPTEFVRGSVYNVTSATTWNTPVNYLYLFGTHSTSDLYARSFIGEIYGAVIREGGQVKVELQPAWKNGVYGFYDRRSNTFYTKDEDNDNLCGKSANFRGVTGHDAQAPINHAEGIPQVGSVYPYTLTIDLANPKIVKNFYMTTATRDIPAGPKKFFLYGSTDGENWNQIIYDQEANWGTAGTAPRISAPATDGNTIQYLYNVDTGTFLLGANDWNTRASVSSDKGYQFKIKLNDDGKYTLNDYVETQSAWKAVFADNSTNIWVDNLEGNHVNDWNIIANNDGTNTYSITNPGASADGKLGVDNTLKDTRLYLNNDAGYATRWAFVNEDDYNDYMGIQTIKYPINENNTSYGKLRLVIESIGSGSTLTLADIVFTSYFDFEHSVGRVYDGTMGTPPDNLAVDGSSGYKQAYKMKGNAPDDPRLNEGVTIQRTHEYEHVLYTLPGETINLTPFSDFDYPNVTDDKAYSSAYNYRERYIRWYDYATDLLSESLSFDPRNGHKVTILDDGHFAWNNTGFNNNRTREGAVAKYKAPESSTNGVFGVIALEAANVFNWDDAIWDATKNAYVVKEPTLQWRHTFVIKDVRKRADDMFENTTKNDTYITNNKIKLMCPANVPFQYPLPSYEYATEGAHHPTDFYYKDNNGVYTPVYHYSIKTEKWDENNSQFVNLGTKTIKTTYIPGDLTTPSEDEINAVPDAIIVTLTDEEKKDKTEEEINTLIAGKIAALTDEQKRALRTEAATADKTTSVTKQLAMSYKTLEGYNRVFYMQEPQEGKYRISIYALSADASTPLRLERFGANTPLPIMQYELDVLSPSDGVMITENELNSNSDYEHQRPANMNAAFGKPTTVVNFDEVEPEQTTTAPDRDNSCSSLTASGTYLMWPWRWEDSSYGFGYTDRGDYNMYMVADHMSITPFHGRGNDDVSDKDTYHNVYDRLYNESKGVEKGYFFYANAASDPSRMSVLNIGKDFCPNTKVFVSAWINEFQGQNVNAETANVIFSFRGVKADGTETVLNSFVSGYVSGGWNTPYGYDKDGFVAAHTTDSDSDGKYDNPDNRGKWMHVYYTFKTGTEAEGYDHYIITLENNCTSSVGADYAIDDIRCYVRKPKVDATQLKPVCNGDPATDLKIYADFDQMMDVFAFDEQDQAKNLYYCFLDREKYESELKKGYDQGVANNSINSATYPTFTDWRENVNKSDINDPFRNAYENAFNAALIKNSYGTGHENYGVLTFNQKYDKNPVYVAVEGFSNEKLYTAQRQDLGTTRNLIFPCHATDANMTVGKDYVIALITEYNDTYSLPVNFKLEDKCQATNDFTVIFSGEIKIDGELISEQQGMEFCSNQRPMVTIDLNGVSENGLPIKTEQAYFDWYYGPLDLNQDEKDQGWTVAYNTEKKNGTLSLDAALGYFRDNYPTATQEDVMKDASTVVEKGTFTQDMLTYIKEMVTAKKITLYKKTEAMPTTDLFCEAELEETTTNKKFYLTAIPINPNPEYEDIKYCLEPIKITINLSSRTPKMKDGDDHGIVAYPETMTDVPLRIGLKQLKRTVINNLNHTFTSSDKLLWLPLRNITPSTNVNTLQLPKLTTSTDDLLYLAASDDPNVLNGTSGAVNIVYGSDSYGDVISDLKVVGRVKEIQADKTKTGNYCKMAFLKNFRFREGYWYTLKFHFTDEGQPEDVCPGDVVFTIKVVPEYQMWTGAVSRNWNDDRNWKRVTKEDLLWKDAEPSVFMRNNTDFADYITDGGTNSNMASYAPADFTKVIIPANLEKIPYMYNLHETGNKAEVQFAGAPATSYQLKTTRPYENIYDQILEAESYEREYVDLDGKMFVITDLTGKNTLGVSHNISSRPTDVGEQNAFVVNNSSYSADDMHVYAKFTRVIKTGAEGNVYTIQLCKANGENFSMWGYNGYLNFQPTGQNIVFALGLGTGQQYGQDAVNCALWKVVSVGDGEITLQNVGNGGYLDPSEAKPSSVPVVCQLAKSFSTLGAGEIYHQTSLVQFDMASIDRSDNDVACRPWYDHTCDQIHFNAGAEIMDQRYLYYNKAWCDIEVPVGTWQTVASPLMNIVAGDLYLPTASARQNTPLFEDITYSRDLNDRFKPAVFQHSWNKSMAKVYELSADKTNVAERNVGVKLDWSHVYNDVNVQYGAGQGFSIKVDVSAMPEADRPAVAKFRFPKADTQYTYYNPSNTDGEKKTETVIDGNTNADGSPINYGPDSNAKRPGRLSDLSGTFQQMVGDTGDNQNPATPTSYFLVGNPLMCWLNMEKFFDNNSQFEKKYWIATADGQRTALFTEGGFISTENNPKFLPPGVSFFVKLNNNQEGTTTSGGPAINVTPQFTADMMSYTQGEKTNEPTTDNRQNGAKQTRAASQTVIPQLSLNATDMNGQQSKAVLTDGTKLQHNGVETLFDSNMKNDIILYTTKNGQAQTIANITPGDTLPLITGNVNGEVKLQINGAADFDYPLYIIDSEEGTVLPLDADVVLSQTTNGVRYYIASSVEHQNNDLQANLPRVTAQHGRITVYAPAGEVISSSQIFTTNGQCVDRASNITTSHTATLQQGIYIVKLQVNGTSYTYKLLLTSK